MNTPSKQTASTDLLPKKRKFKEIKPERPHLIGNKFAAKPKEERKTKSIFIEMTEAAKLKCEQAAKLLGVKVTPWARQVLLAEADKVKAEPHNTTQSN